MDRGLILRRLLEEEGFGLVRLNEPAAADGAGPQAPPYSREAFERDRFGQSGDDLRDARKAATDGAALADPVVQGIRDQFLRVESDLYGTAALRGFVGYLLAILERRDGPPAFPIYQCEEWQCRHVFRDGTCCSLPTDHAQPHQHQPGRIAQRDGAGSFPPPDALDLIREIYQAHRDVNEYDSDCQPSGQDASGPVGPFTDVPCDWCVAAKRVLDEAARGRLVQGQEPQ